MSSLTKDEMIRQTHEAEMLFRQEMIDKLDTLTEYTMIEDICLLSTSSLDTILRLIQTADHYK